MKKTLILKNGYGILNNGDLKNQLISIRIENGRISNITKVDTPENEEGCEVLDLKGKLVSPGFVNGHNHLSMSLFRNYADDMKLMDWLFGKIFPLEDQLTAETARLGAELALCEMIRTGTTITSDMYFFMEDVAEVVGASGMKAALSRGLQGDSGEGIDYRLKENLELFQRFNGAFGGNLKIMLGPHSVYTCNPAYLQKLGNVSEKYGISLQMHLAETKDEVANCIQTYGVRPVKLAYDCGLLKKSTVAAHGVVLSEADMDILAMTGTSVIHNPNSNQKLSSGIAPIIRLLEKGINVGIGTDGAASNNRLDMLSEIRSATYLQKVSTEDPTALPVDTVLTMATRNGARALGFENTGEIAVGMDADLVIFDTSKPNWYPKHNMNSALVYSGSSGDIESVMVKGKFLMRNRELLTIDEERILSEINKWTLKL